MKESETVWQKFASLPGAAINNMIGIASEHAIGGLIDVMLKYQPVRILEIGAGIGTLTYTILQSVEKLNIHKNPNYRFYTVENNEFCLTQLESNLKTFQGLYSVVLSTDKIPEMEFDLIVIDGGGDLGNDMGVMNFNNRMAKKGVILVEGARAFQRNLIGKWYQDRDFVYGRFASFNRKLVSQKTGKITKNKSFHLFVFEPAPFERFMIRFKAVINTLAFKVMRRLLGKS